MWLDNNKQLWLGVTALLVLYLIFVLEDIVEQLKRNRYIVLSLADGSSHVVDGEFRTIKDATPKPK